MEQFCNEIKDKVCVDYDSEEIQDIIKAVDILMNRFVDEFKLKYPDIKIENIILCGSMAEKTRVWRSDASDIEFDYLAVLKSWPGCGDFVFEPSLYGCMVVKHTVADQRSTDGESVNLNRKIKVAFLQIFKKCIFEKCERSLCALNVKCCENHMVIPEVNGCQFCSAYMKTGTLKCINPLSCTRGHSGKLKFLWTSKNKSIDIPQPEPSECDNSTKVRITYDKNEDIGIDETCLSRQFHWKNCYVLRVEVGTDFHPVIELDLTRVQANHRIKPPTEHFQAYLLLPNSHQHVYWKISKYQAESHKEQKLIYFVLNILLKSLGLIIGQVPELHKNVKYLLFPKGYIHSQWKISTCQKELDIISETTAEHRSAYCVLKYLILILKLETPRENIPSLPDIQHYEAKIAVIRHIKCCKTPRIGAHVCLLNIMFDIALCRGARIMEHPILHLDVYDMLTHWYSHTFDTTSVISFKILILILAYQRVGYTYTDLINDLLSIKLIWDAKKSASEKYILAENDKREALNELKTLVQNRKRNTSRKVLSKLVIALLRKDRLRDFQYSLVQKHLKDLDRSDLCSGIREYNWMY